MALLLHLIYVVACSFPVMERREANQDAQKIAIHGLLDCNILVADGLDLLPFIPFPSLVVASCYKNKRAFSYLCCTATYKSNSIKPR